MRRFRPRLTYANVVSTLCLVIVLGGTAYAAATIGPADIKNDAVRSRHVKEGEVRNANLGANAVTTSKVADGSITRSDLSQPVASNLQDRCPSDMGKIGGSLCMDKVARGSREWYDGALICAGAQRRLPSPSELILASVNGKLAVGATYWSDAYTANNVAVGVYGNGSAPGLQVSPTDHHHFVACATNPSSG